MPSGHFGLSRSNARWVTGINSNAIPLSSTNAIDDFNGEKPWIAESLMLVAYAVPRKLNMATTVTIAATLKARFLNRLSRSSGVRVRFSATMNSARKTNKLDELPIGGCPTRWSALG